MISIVDQRNTLNDMVEDIFEPLNIDHRHLNDSLMMYYIDNMIAMDEMQFSNDDSFVDPYKSDFLYSMDIVHISMHQAK